MASREARAEKGRLAVVAFDVTSDRRRIRLGRTLTGWGRRTQYSVFECLVRPADEARFLEAIARHIEPAEDRLAIYWICGTCRERASQLGEPLARLDGEDWILV